MENFITLPFPVDDKVPNGYRFILAYGKDNEVVVPLTLQDLPGDYHNCDWEGCSTLHHVVRFNIKYKYDIEKQLSTTELPKKKKFKITADVGILSSKSKQFQFSDYEVIKKLLRKYKFSINDETHEIEDPKDLAELSWDEVIELEKTFICFVNYDNDEYNEIGIKLS